MPPADVIIVPSENPNLCYYPLEPIKEIIEKTLYSQLGYPDGVRITINAILSDQSIDMEEINLVYLNAIEADSITRQERVQQQQQQQAEEQERKKLLKNDRGYGATGINIKSNKPIGNRQNSLRDEEDEEDDEDDEDDEEDKTEKKLEMTERGRRKWLVRGYKKKGGKKYYKKNITLKKKIVKKTNEKLKTKSKKTRRQKNLRKVTLKHKKPRKHKSIKHKYRKHKL